MIKFIKFVEVPVADQNRAVKFYTEKLGFSVGQDSPYKDGWRWIELRIPGAETAALLTKRTDDQQTETPILVFIVDDVAATYNELKAKGVTFTQEPTEAQWNKGQKFALLIDSEDNTIMIGSD